MDIEKIIRDIGFSSKRASSIEKLIKPSIRVCSFLSNDEHLKLGTSKLGGSPDLPPGFKWPVFEDSPLSFLAQLNLLDVKQYDIEGILPTEGMLYFFYNDENQVWGFDPADRGNWLVAYSNIPYQQLSRTAPPPKLHQNGIFDTGKLSFYPEYIIPGWESLPIQSLDLDREELDKYLVLAEQVNSWNDPNMHRLLGYPQEIQGEMQLECQLVSHGLYMGDADAYNDPRVRELKPGAHNWQLLFQLDSEEDLGMFWGDVGRLYFWIPQDALKARDFEQVWLILQCY